MSSAARSNQPGGLDDLLDEIGVEAAPVGAARCPNCGTPTPPGAVVCVKCGFHAERGERIEGYSGRGADGHTGASDVLLARAAHQIDKDRVESRKSSDAVPWYIYIILMVGLLAACGVGVVISNRIYKQKDAEGNTIEQEASALDDYSVVQLLGGVLLLMGGLFSLVGQLRMVFAAFTEKPLEGVLVLFVPFYVFYYAFTRWDQCGGAFKMWLMGQIVSGGGLALVVIGSTG